jgi:hypothetical protein
MFTEGGVHIEVHSLVEKSPSIDVEVAANKV